MSDIGPIRLAATTKDGRPVPDARGDVAVAWTICQARMSPDRKIRYVIIPFPETFSPTLVRCWLENGIDTLQYLVDHPDIEEI